MNLALSGRGNFKGAPHTAEAWVLFLARFPERIGIKGQRKEIRKLVIWPERSTHKALVKDVVITKKKPSALN